MATARASRQTLRTHALPLDQIRKLCHASTLLEAPFRDLIRDISEKEGKPPLCVIYDVLNGWADGVSKFCGTINVAFSTCGTYGGAAYASCWQHLPPRLTDKDEFNIPGFPNAHHFHVTNLHHVLRSADGTDSWSRFFQPQIGSSLNSFGWLCNTAEEIEPFGLSVLRRYVNRPIWCIGPLLPPSMLSPKPHCIIGQYTGRETSIPPEECLQWLDLQSEKSVLYISFGSQNPISPSQMMALATGLEDSNRRFLWVIRPPTGFNMRREFKSKWLPHGFQEQMANTNPGLLVHGWAPQPDILCHRSMAAFLIHCGWNPVGQGVPIIGWPLSGDQGFNAKMLVEEMGECVVLTRGTESSISREDMKRVIETVMEEEEMRQKAGEIRELIRAAVEGSSDKAMDDFVSALLSSKPVKG